MDNSNVGAMHEEQNADIAELLSQQERKTLTACEKTITANIRSFVKVGESLRAIRDRRLYRETHKTFEAYCRDRWDFTRTHGYRLIASAETMEVLSPVGGALPTAETQVRPLLQFDLADRPKVWQDVCARLGSATSRGRANQVNEIVQDLIGHSDDELYHRHRVEVKEKKQEMLRQAEERHQQQMFDAHGPHETPFSDDKLGQLGEIASKLDKAFARAKLSYGVVAIPDDHAVGHLMMSIEIAIKRLDSWVAGQSEAKEAA
jgi:hypothetical protein